MNSTEILWLVHWIDVPDACVSTWQTLDCRFGSVVIWEMGDLYHNPTVYCWPFYSADNQRAKMDNLTNWWGKSLIPDALTSRRGPSGADDRDNSYYGLESTVIMATTNDYRLDTCTANGTLANSTAMQILSAEYFDPACTIMVASRSYVGGSGLGFQSDIWVRRSTTTLSPAGNLAFVKGPYDPTVTVEARHCTCPLPYFIETNYDPDPNFIAHYEDQCLDELHATCLLATLQKRPVRGILLELMLAGNGASLSDRTLARLGKLASHHDFWFIVDEVMTGGRVDGSFLLVQQAPQEFKERVKYVTMGKWMGLGMVLSNRMYPIDALPQPAVVSPQLLRPRMQIV